MDGKILCVLAAFYLITSCIITIKAIAVDPCHPSVFKSFPSSDMGSRNEKCGTRKNAICDYFLPKSWYSAQNSTLLDHCPNGQCGVSYPAWMKGKHPDENEGVVNRTVCIKEQNYCCKEQLTLLVKNCSQFYVYYLTPLKTCYSVYCFESSKPCNEPETKEHKKNEEPTTSTIEYLVKDGSDIIRYVQNNQGKATIIACSVLAGVIALVGAGIIIALLIYKKSDKTRSRVNTNYETTLSSGLPPPCYEELSDSTKVQASVIQ